MLALEMVTFPLLKGNKMVGLSAPIVPPFPSGNPVTMYSISGQSEGSAASASLVRLLNPFLNSAGIFSKARYPPAELSGPAWSSRYWRRIVCEFAGSLTMPITLGVVIPELTVKKSLSWRF
jgi:hypothetical protein